MVDAGYLLTLNDIFTDHADNSSVALNDAELQLDVMQVKAMVASQDCFITIATEIDKLSEILPKSVSGNAKLELEKITRLLMYMQQHYKVVNK